MLFLLIINFFWGGGAKLIYVHLFIYVYTKNLFKLIFNILRIFLEQFMKNIKLNYQALPNKIYHFMNF